MKTHWTVYLAAAATAASLTWQLSDRLFRPLEELRERVLILETQQKYLHGSFAVPKE